MEQPIQLFSGPWAIERGAKDNIRARILGMDPEAVRRDSQRAPKHTREREVQGKLGIVPLLGTLTPHDDPLLALFGGNTSTIAAGQALLEFAADDSIHHILIPVDSPGGMVAGSQELSDIVFSIRGTKPIHAHVTGMGASAAYWAISGAHKITCASTDMVGSVGVSAIFHDESESFKKQGVETIAITSGRFKAAGEPGLPITDEQKAESQILVDSLMDEFRKSVQRGRGFDRQQFEAVADGRLFVGRDALELNLIDEIVPSLGASIERMQAAWTRQVCCRAKMSMSAAFVSTF